MHFLTLTLHIKISIGISFLVWFANLSYGLNVQAVELKLNTLVVSFIVILMIALLEYFNPYKFMYLKSACVECKFLTIQYILLAAHPKNYRPISLTSVICKTMEHIIVSQLMKHLESFNIIAENQFGFREHHSCESQLLLTVNDIATAINNKLQVDLAVLNFSKAFNKVAHVRRLLELDYYGVRGSVLNWFKSALQNRAQQVVVEGHYSRPCDITSGVLQGSFLGSALFLVYINDITA